MFNVISVLLISQLFTAQLSAAEPTGRVGGASSRERMSITDQCGAAASRSWVIECRERASMRTWHRLCRT